MDEKAPARFVAVAWYDRSNYDQIRALAHRHKIGMPPFEKWLDEAERQIAALNSSILVEKVPVDAAEFFAWFAALDIKPDHRARAAFVHDLVSVKYAIKH